MSTTELQEGFREFLRGFKTEMEEHKYRKKLSQMALTGSKSLVVDFEDLMAFDSELAKEIVNNPDEALKYANASALEQMKVEDPEYAEQVKELFVRFRGLPERLSLRKMRADHIGRLVMIDAIVVRATPVQPLVVRAAFRCRRCNEMTFVDQKGPLMRGPLFCANCKARLFEFDEKESTFIDSQEIRAQEKPEELPPGQLPRSIEVTLRDDLVDTARPGDRASIIGIVRAQQTIAGRRGGLRMFDLYLDANYVDVSGREAEILEITPEEERYLKGLSKDPWILNRLKVSIAPSIYGYEDVKEAILYLLHGGVRKELPDGINLRGDMNVLLVGDPGTAKSALLQYVARVAPRGLYTSGRGSTAAGLTAAVIREKSGGMALEAGALVLADKGICSIDEIDKMRPEDRVAIHEAMEQQTVSVAKGGIVATLNARASVLAAANPALGRYDPYRNVGENINLPITILSRFDLIFVFRDTPDEELDRRMSEHILRTHQIKATPVPEVAPLPPEVLRKYISYAKRITPTLTDEAIRELKDFYLKMRSTSGASDSPIAITPRQLEALVRISEARARCFLRDKVTAEDAKATIRLMTISLQHVGVDVATGKIDIDVIMTGKPKSLRDKMQMVMGAIAEGEREGGAAEEGKLRELLVKQYGLSEAEVASLLNQLVREGIIYSPKPGQYKRAMV
jgi:replicative DNA helicase Mcm